MVRMIATRRPAPKAATRQLNKWVSVVMKIGVVAQPRLPVIPCALKAWPRRGLLTRRLRMEKSTGWKTELPMPATTAPAISQP